MKILLADEQLKNRSISLTTQVIPGVKTYQRYGFGIQEDNLQYGKLKVMDGWFMFNPKNEAESYPLKRPEEESEVQWPKPIVPESKLCTF